MLEAILLVFLCVVIAVWIWGRVKTRYPSPPMYPGALPIIGHAHLLIGDAQKLWKTEKAVYQYCNDNGGIVLVMFGPHHLYFISDVEDSLLVANTCLDKPYLYEFGKEMYNRGLVTAGTSTWKPHRKLMNPAFNQQVLNTFVNEYSKEAKKLVSELEKEVGKGPFDVQPYLVKVLLSTVCQTTLGINTKDQTTIVKNYSYATKALFNLYRDRLQRVWLHLPCIFNMSSLKKKESELMNILKDITKGIIRKRKSELAPNKIDKINDADTKSDKFKPLLNQMLELSDKEDVLSDDEIREHLDTVIAATYDTTTKALTTMLVLIGTHQDVQEKLVKELQEVLGDEDKDLSRYDLPKLVYMEAVIKETLRLNPPVPRIGRTSATDVKLKNYTIPAGRTLIVSVYSIGRNPVWGPDANQFRPERWLDRATLPENPNAFASFSLGKRNCLGKQYALMVMKTYLAHILRRYRITGDFNSVEMTCDLLIQFVKGHHISLELRT